MACAARYCTALHAPTANLCQEDHATRYAGLTGARVMRALDVYGLI